MTGGLDDTQLRNLAERLIYLRELAARRKSIFESIDGQGKMTDELARKIASVTTKAELEDLYLPYKPKRRTAPRSPARRGCSRWPTRSLPTARATRSSSQSVTSPKMCRT